MCDRPVLAYRYIVRALVIAEPVFSLSSYLIKIKQLKGKRLIKINSKTILLASTLARKFTTLSTSLLFLWHCRIFNFTNTDCAVWQEFCHICPMFTCLNNSFMGRGGVTVALSVTLCRTWFKVNRYADFLTTIQLQKPISQHAPH